LKKNKKKEEPVSKGEEKAEATDVKKDKEVKTKETKTVTDSLYHIIKHPRITEKAAILSGDGVYTFEIDPNATKIDVARAIKAIYKVEPVKVAISKLPSKRKFIRGKRGKTAAVKKAIVYLKKGDTIEFV
ncbi:MAG: 50S ribosomal protein L23, partial [Candidatus Pacebacteria bacterium]|nr:50S ribosomal protein L23 [Candidatus Paceibacterota bacterium]